MDFSAPGADMGDLNQQTDEKRMVCLGEATARWDKIGSDRSLKSDNEVLNFLIKYYEDTCVGSQAGACCGNCLTPLTLSCATCGQRPGISGPEKKVVAPHAKNGTSGNNASVDLLDSDPASPNAEQVAQTMVQLAFTTEEPPTPVISTSSDGQKLHACPHCGVKFAHQNGLSRHLSLEICYTKQEPVIPNLRPRRVARVQNKSFRCTECGMKFLEADQLTEHMEIHSQEMPYKCSQCGAGFQKSSVLALHLAKHEGRHVCYICGSEFVNSHGLTAHLKTEVCSSQAPSQVGLNDQGQSGSQDNPLDKNTCKYCKKKFASPAHLKRHVLTHTGERPFACQECGASFTQKARLIDHHQREHLKDKPIKCNACGRKFFTTPELNRHRCRPQSVNFGDMENDDDFEEEDEDEEENSRPYKCQYCEAEFAYSAHLTKHIQKHTGQKEFKCPHCDKVCGDARYLKQHLRKHTQPKKPKDPNARPFKCHICPRAFKDKKMLQVHLRVHTGEKPFQCTTCGKAFAQRCNFRRHVRTHTGERPHECKECGKRFAHYTTYVGHVRLHTGARPYKCQHCDKTFRQSYSLTIHNRTHTNEKPYVCNQCSAAFAHPSSLSIHIRTHTGEKPYKCLFCDQAFASASNRRAHMKKTHKEFQPGESGEASNATDANNRKPRARKPKQEVEMEREKMMLPQIDTTLTQPQVQPMQQAVSVSVPVPDQTAQNMYRPDGMPVSVYGLWDGVRAPIQFAPPPPDAHSGPTIHMQAMWNDFRQPHDLSRAQPHQHPHHWN